jgi:hypothetical protein
LIPGKGGRAYFFVEERLNKMHKLGNFPRYNNEETEAFVARNSDIRYNQGPTVADVWKTAVSYRLVPLEEGLFKIWTWGRLDRLFVSYGMAHLSDFMPEMISGMMIGAVKLDFLPLPLASLRGKEPFNPAQGYGSKESKLRRALSALPFLMLVFAKLMVLDTNFLLPWAEEILENGAVEVGGEPVPIMRTFHRVKGVDDLSAEPQPCSSMTQANYASQILRHQYILLPDCLQLCTHRSSAGHLFPH